MAESWEPCPRCASRRVRVVGKWGTFGYGLLFFAVSPLAALVLMFVVGPFAFVPLALGVLIGLVLMVGAPFAPGRATCQDCRKSWTLKRQRATA